MTTLTLTPYINVAGVVLIVFILWWFFGFKPKTTESAQEFTIEVNNGIYTPAHIKARVNKPLQLHFIRKSESPCAGTVVFETLGLSADLPFNEIKTIEFTPKERGDFSFTCQMAMYRGSLTIV
jgi:plastocyanin domain-containing protein